MTWLQTRRPSASMIVALIALFVALGGSSYAAVTLAKNSVGSKQLKKNAVTTAKIKNGAVTGNKIKNGAVTGNKIKDGAVTGNKVQLSSLGTVPSASTADSVTGLGTLRSGQSESGIWGTSGPTSDYAIAELSFHLQLAAPLDSTHTIYVSGASATHCPGAGQADAGYLCVYLGEAHGLTLYAILAPGGGGSSSTFGADKTGATIYFNTSSSEPIYGDGQWTVTAP